MKSVNYKNLSDLLYKITDDKCCFKITENSEIGEYEFWDSITNLNLLLLIESSYQISFTTEELTELKSIKDILRVTNQYLDNVNNN